MRAVLVAATTLALGACASMPMHLHRGPDPSTHLEFLMRALTADVTEREAMWQDTARLPPGDEATLHRALLRTVPGHTGFDLAAGEVELQGLLARSPPADIAPVARARLEDLRTSGMCRQEVDVLKKRLSKVADIERRLDNERRR